LDSFDEVGYGEGFAGTSNAEKHLMVFAFFDPFDKFFYRHRLIA